MILNSRMTKTEVENALKGKGNYVQIDMLGRFLKEPIALETKKFALIKLAELYENSKMYNDSAKMYGNAAELCLTFQEKINLYIRETELYIKAGTFDRAELAMRKALSEASLKEKEKVYESVKGFYRAQAIVHEKELRRGHAVKFYEKMLELRLSDQERKEVKEKLLDIYEKLGDIPKYNAIKRGLTGV